MSLDPSKSVVLGEAWQLPIVENMSCTPHHIPDEVLCNIFLLSEQSSFMHIPVVCKKWQIVYDRELYQHFLAKIAVFSKDWEDLDVTAEGDKQFTLTNKQVPFKALLSDIPQTITWVPERVKKIIVHEDGSEEEQYFSLDTGKELEALVANPKKGFPASFCKSNEDAQKILEMKWEVEKSHWEWIVFSPIALGETYAAQEAEVLGQGSGADVTVRRAGTISLLMKKVKFGECCVKRDQYYIRFKDLAAYNGHDFRIETGFCSSGLLATSVVGDGRYVKITVAVSKKFFASQVADS